MSEEGESSVIEGQSEEVIKSSAAESTEEESKVSSEQDKPNSYLDFEKLPEDVRPKVKERVGELTRKYHDTDRDLQAERKRRQELEQQLLEREKPKEVAQPSADTAIDDPEEFSRQLAAREQYLRDLADHDAKIKAITQAEEAKQKQLSEQRVSQYQKRAAALAVDNAKLVQSENIVGSVLRSQEVANFLLDHKYGPQLAIHLAENPSELYSVASMAPMDAAIQLENISRRFNKPTNTPGPDPHDTISGRGAPEKENPLLKGATFE